MDLKREGGSHRHDERESREPGLWGTDLAFCFVLHPLSFLGVKREVGLWKMRTMWVNLLGVAVSLDFLTQPWTVMET